MSAWVSWWPASCGPDPGWQTNPSPPAALAVTTIGPISALTAIDVTSQPRSRFDLAATTISPRTDQRASTVSASRKLDETITFRRSLLEQLPGHHGPLDLVGALVDLGDLRVPHHSLDRVIADVSVAAEQLHRVGGHLHRDVGGEALAG